ncbi:preprotein translocase subunit YajC [Microbacterium amylolyticum]|uniref:Preprotein translocase subunit YajC n=1 Tax=Microbacterium amylolyticum TaxID=936337 RepID=A0ABS4ZE16_9MICO|nr:preprotein translocase subunit YajC [Microbacterium amylolyticum]MBP2435520.1 preprotein translocase subunit YajC [Microbacterium amylolyticum]
MENFLLLAVAGGLIVFMFWSSTRRRKKMQEEEQKRQQMMLPGASVMTRSGIYGTLVSFDPDDLTQHAVIAIAPGVEIEVHAQTVVIDPEAEHELVDDDEDIDADDVNSDGIAEDGVIDSDSELADQDQQDDSDSKKD